MNPVLRCLTCLLLLAPAWVHGEETVVFRQWIAGQEAGGSTRKVSRTPEGERQESREWTRMERMGTVIQQELKESALRRPDGSIHFTWRLSLSQEPLQGEADWAPSAPRRLNLTFSNGPARSVELPAGLTLWPGEADEALKAAARNRRPVSLKTFTLPTQQFASLDLEPEGPDPLPGFPDAVRFKGSAMEGSMAGEVRVWISPVEGELKQEGSLAGIPLVSQRTGLPAPAPGEAGQGIFERSLKTLPPHAFMLWLPSVQVRWSGDGSQELPEDPQQRRLAPNRYGLSRSPAPSGPSARELPVKGRPSPEDAPYLAATPLVQFKDPVFEGLERRLRPHEGATRWELAQRVTAFVYDWILDKNYTVGFASAQEVARTPRGDCTEHGVLAVALLRRLGVPARGVTGWVAYGGTLGLHFWAEARIGGRWVPLDPTFDQAPASAFRLKLGTTDLADLGSVQWEKATTTFLEGAWIPEGPWGRDILIQGDTLTTPDGTSLRVQGARWQQADGLLDLLGSGTHRVEAVPRPNPSQVAGALSLQGARTGRQGWWSRATRQLWIDLDEGRWLQVEGISEGEAHRLLDQLEVGAGRAVRAAA